MATKRQIIETSVWLARLGFGAQAIQRLIRYERTLHHLDERRCNGEGWERAGDWTDADDRRYDQRAEALVRYAQDVCDACRYHDAPAAVAYHQSDPRGGALWIVPSAALGTRDIESCYTCGVCC